MPIMLQTGPVDACAEDLAAANVHFDGRVVQQHPHVHIGVLHNKIKPRHASTWWLS
jgi:hypothetical protein